MKNKFLEILKDAYPSGFAPIYTSGASLQLWREEMAFALEAAAQQGVQADEFVCLACKKSLATYWSFCPQCGQSQVTRR